MRFFKELKLEPLFGEKHLFLPDYSKSIALIPDTIKGIFLGKHQGLEFELPQSNRVVLLFIDSVGFGEFKAFCKKFKPKLLKKGSCFCISSIAPATTCVCTTTISTGTLSSQANFFLHRLYFEEEKSVFDFLRFKKIFPTLKELSEKQTEKLLQRFSFRQTIFERLKKIGVSSFSVIPKQIEKSPFRKITDKGANTITYESLSQLAIKTKNALKGKQKFFCSIYWPGPDTISHHLGDTREIFFDLDLFFKAIDWLVRDLKDCLFLIISDHGRVKLDKAYFSNDDKKLNSLLAAPPFGNGRLANLKAKKGKQKQLFDYLNKKYGKAFLILKAERALNAKLYGPNGRKSERIGDFMLIARKPVKMVYDAKGKRIKDLASHSGLTKKELLVPFAYFKK